MPDVGSQLADYFEAAIERIDADDVFAAAAVRRQLREHRASQRRVRPAWAVAAGFIGVVVLIGGVMLSAWWAQRPDSAERGPRSFTAPVVDSGGGSTWWPALLIGGVAAVVVLISLRHHRATKEVDMRTIDEKQQETTASQTPHRSRKPWLIGMAILVAVAAAIGTWAVIDANQTSDIEVATEFADTWSDAWMTGDGESVAVLFTEDGVWTDGNASQRGRESISGYISLFGVFPFVAHGEVVDLGDGVFTTPVSALYGNDRHEGEMRLTLEGNLVSHAELVDFGIVSD